MRRIVLKDMLDAAELSARDDIDWGIVQHAFAESGATTELDSFLCAAGTLVDLETPISDPHDEAVRAWAESAVRALHAPANRLRTSLRIAGYYLRQFMRNPSRRGIIWQTLKDPARLKSIIETNRDRLRA